MEGRRLFYKNGNNADFLTRISAYSVGFCYDFINLFLKIFARILWPERIKNPQKICIYRVGNIGDIICSIPAFIAVRRAYPDAHITLLTSPGSKGKPGAKELFDNVWFFDRVWVYYGDEINGLKNIREFSKKIRREKFDLLIYLPQELITLKTIVRNFIFIKSCGIKKAVGFEYSTIKFLAKEQSAVYQFDNEVDRLLNLLKRWNVPIKGGIEYDLPISENIKKSSLNIIREYKIGHKNVFGFMPSASYDANQWPLDNFVEVGKFILKNYPDSQIVIFGGSADGVKGEYIKEKIGSDKIINLCGKTSLLETAFIVNNLELIISNNTGLMHMAALAGVKTIAIFFANELNGKWFPTYGDNVRLLAKFGFLDCEGNYYKGCPHNYRCVRGVIVTKDVKKAIVELLEP